MCVMKVILGAAWQDRGCGGSSPMGGTAHPVCPEVAPARMRPMDTALFEERVKEIPRLRSCLSGSRVERWPRKQALRDMLFDIVIDCMHEGPTWTEREITQELAAITADPVTLRRALIDERRLLRSPDGSQYRLALKAASG